MVASGHSLAVSMTKIDWLASQPVDWLTALGLFECLPANLVLQDLKLEVVHGCLPQALGVDGCSWAVKRLPACCCSLWAHACLMVMVLVGCHHCQYILDLLHHGELVVMERFEQLTV